MVLDINGNEIFAKAGLDKPDDYKFFNLLKVMDAASSNFLESFMKGSKEAGISAEKILVYVSKLPNFAVIIPVIDKAAVEERLKKIESSEPVDGDGFRYLTTDNAISIAWNDNLAIISNASSRETIAELFKSKDDGLLATNKDFETFLKKDADIRLWAQYNFLIDVYQNVMFFVPDDFEGDKNPAMLLFDDLKTLSAHAYLNFENGKITGSALAYPPEEVEKLHQKYPLFKDRFNTVLTKDISELSYLAINCFLDVKEYVKVVRQNVEKILADGSISGSDVTEKQDELSAMFDSPEFKSVVDALDGDILLNIHGFTKGMFTYPLASIGFTVKNDEAFDNLLKLIPSKHYKKQENYYSLTTEQTFIPVYFAYKDNRVFVSNDLNATKSFIAGLSEKTFADNPIGKIMSDRMLFYLNLNLNAYPENVKMLAQSSMGNEYKLFTSFIEIYDYAYCAGDKYNTEFNLQLKNKEINSLKQILRNIDNIVSSSWMN
jgi:hypothetical protein